MGNYCSKLIDASLTHTLLISSKDKNKETKTCNPFINVIDFVYYQGALAGSSIALKKLNTEMDHEKCSFFSDEIKRLSSHCETSSIKHKRRRNTISLKSITSVSKIKKKKTEIIDDRLKSVDYKGVLMTISGKYVVEMELFGKIFTFGSYYSEKDAAEAHDRAMVAQIYFLQ